MHTVIRVNCGSEFRTRYGTAHDDVITGCITQVRTAGVTQPITSIDTWWEWCNRSWPCQQLDLFNQVDWIGINIFPWWENKYSGLFTCTTAEQAAAFHLARYDDIASRYPGKPVIITEFGWPAGPRGYYETNPTSRARKDQPARIGAFVRQHRHTRAHSLTACGIVRLCHWSSGISRRRVLFCKARMNSCIL